MTHSIHAPRTRNYLRARGEYVNRSFALGAVNGTTSAHAENTNIFPNIHENIRNYLRARGEY